MAFDERVPRRGSFHTADPISQWSEIVGAAEKAFGGMSHEFGLVIGWSR